MDEAYRSFRSKKKANLFPKTAEFHAIQYAEGNWKYSEKQIEQAKSSLKGDLLKLGNRPLTNLAKDWETLQPRDRDTLFGLLPFLYKENGEALFKEVNERTRSQLQKRIEALDGRAIWEKYVSPYYLHFFSSLADSTFPTSGGSYVQAYNGLVERANRLRAFSAGRPIGADGNAVPMHTLSLEEMSPYEAIARSYFTEDCASYYGLNYPLDGETRYYAVRKSWNRSQTPVAWFVTTVASDGRKGRFIDAAGHDLSQTDVEHLMAVIKKSEGANRMFTRNYGVKEGVNVNSENIIQAFKEARESSVTLSLPDHWDRYGETSAKAWDLEEANDVLSREDLKKGWKLKVGPKDKEVGAEIHTVVPGFGYESARMDRLPYLNRVAYAARVYRLRDMMYDRKPEHRADLIEETLATQFQVDLNDMRAIVELTKVALPQEIELAPLKHFLTKFPDQREKLFSITFPLGILNALTKLHQTEPEFLPEQDWKRLFKESVGRLRAERAEYEGRENDMIVEHGLNSTRWPTYFSELNKAILSSPKDLAPELRPQDFGFKFDKEAYDLLSPFEKYKAIEEYAKKAKPAMALRPEMFYAFFGVEQQSMNDLHNYFTAPSNFRERGLEAMRKLGISIEEILPHLQLLESIRLTEMAFQKENPGLGSTRWKKIFKGIVREVEKAIIATSDYYATTGDYFRFLLNMPSGYNQMNWEKLAGTHVGRHVLPEELAKQKGLWTISQQKAVVSWLGNNQVPDHVRKKLLIAILHQPSELFWKSLEEALERHVTGNPQPAGDYLWVDYLRSMHHWSPKIWRLLSSNLDQFNARKLIVTNLNWPEKHREKMARYLADHEGLDDETRAIGKHMLTFRCPLRQVAEHEENE